MQFPELIDRKRAGGALSVKELAFFVEAMCADRLSDSEIGAMAKAILLRSMDHDETVGLTAAMRDSGDVLRWDGLDGPVVDKHSTGGVGDTTSLILAPLLAACGAYVPMISGRALGHTGGTLDKLEAIPGYDVSPAPEGFQRCVREVGCAIVGQTERLAPADRRLYRVRDATGTIASTPLITASILSKKLAAGVSALVIDVKTGSGAFMAHLADTRELTNALVAVSRSLDLATSVLLTDMSQPLASVAGNALEVSYAIDFLTGARREPAMQQVVLALGAELLISTGLAAAFEDAQNLLVASLDSGAAATRFEQMVHRLGGPADLLVQTSRYLPKARVRRNVLPRRDGYVEAIDVRALGRAAAQLVATDAGAGFSAVARIGDRVGVDQPLAQIYAASETDASVAAAAVEAAYQLADTPVTGPRLVIERVGLQ